MLISSELTLKQAQQLSRIIVRLTPYLLGLTLLALGIFFASKIAWASASFGIGVDTDTVYYSWFARNLVAGQGLGRLDGEGQFIPIATWPPLYPIILAGFELLGIDILAGARSLALLLAGLNIFLVGLVIHRLSRSVWLSAVGALLAALSPVLTQTSLWALTEPLYLCLTLLAFLCLDRYLQKPSPRWGVLFGACLGAAFLTRYVGVSLVGAALLAVFLLTPGSLLDRVRRVALPAALALLPMAAWVARNRLVAGTFADRRPGYIPLEAWEGERLLESLQKITEPLKSVLTLDTTAIGFAIGAVLVFLLTRRFLTLEKTIETKPVSALFWALIFYEAAYAAVLGLSRLYLDDGIQLYIDRMLAPLVLNSLVLLLGGFGLFWSRIASRSLIAGTVLLGIGLFILVPFARGYAQASDIILERQQRNGTGLYAEFTEKRLLAEAVRQVSPSSIFFTNNIERLYYLVEQPCDLIFQFDSQTAEQIRSAPQRRGQAAIVLFYKDAEMVAQLQQRLPEFKIVYDGLDGLVAVHP